MKDLDAGLVNEIRDTTNGNFVLGDKRFKEQINNTLKKRVSSLEKQGDQLRKRNNRGLSPIYADLRFKLNPVRAKMVEHAADYRW